MSDESTAIQVKDRNGQIQTLDYGEFADQGSQGLPTTGRILYITLLQSSSKALKRGHERYVEGARAGDFLLGDEVIDGEKGFFFIGIEKQHVLVEMTKLDGTGEKVAEHDPNGEVAQKARAKYGTNRFNWRSEAGNFLVDSIRLYGVVFASKEDMDALRPKCAAIIDFQKTRMRAWEAYTSPFNKLPNKGRPPLFAAKLHITSKMENRKGHDYYNYNLRFAENGDFLSSLFRMTNADGTPNEKFIEFGRECLKIAESVRSGSLRGEESSAEGDGEEGDDIPF